jgi:hypothetical protein
MINMVSCSFPLTPLKQTGRSCVSVSSPGTRAAPRRVVPAHRVVEAMRLSQFGDGRCGELLGVEKITWTINLR